jgi:CheY-like chemotaxis protein
MGQPAGSMRNRRRRMRARISWAAHIRGGIGTLESFDDRAKSVDVSRDGVLMTTARCGYWPGQLLEVTCRYSQHPGAINAARRAKVVRSVLTSTFNYALAVEFLRDSDASNNGVWAATPYPNQVRILGIESDPRAAHAIRGLLEQDGYHVLYVETAEQALAILRSETPDVLVVESEGGAISGLDLCWIVKTTDRLQHIPVILLTSSAMPSDYSAGRHLGAIVCMKKPCPPGQLQDAVHMVAPPPAQRTVYSGRFNMGAFVRTT